MTEQPSIKPEKVRDLRYRMRLTQQELSTKADISLGQLSRIETGKIERPQFRTVRKLADALGVDPDELLDGNGNGNGNGVS